MTMTVNLMPRCSALCAAAVPPWGVLPSALMREALQAYLAQTEPPSPSAYALGGYLFGKHAGSQDLASQRKAELQRIWDAKAPLISCCPRS